MMSHLYSVFESAKSFGRTPKLFNKGKALSDSENGIVAFKQKLK